MRAEVPRWVWALVTWVVVVAATSTLAWVAISRAGDQVLGGAAPAPLRSSDASTPLPTGSTPPTAPTSSPPSSSPPSPSSTGTPSSAPSTATTSPPSADPVDRTVTVTGGQVSVRCTGDTVSLLGASPSSGWTVQNDAQPGDVRIEFRSDAGESKVRARCVAGAPEFEIDDAAD